MITRKLDCNWKMRQANTGDTIEAVVPGTVYCDLLHSGKMEDPFWKDNEDKALKLMDYDYEYFTSTTVS